MVSGQQVTCPRHSSRTRCSPRTLRAPHEPRGTGPAEPWWAGLLDPHPHPDPAQQSDPGQQPALGSALGWVPLSLCPCEALVRESVREGSRGRVTDTRGVRMSPTALLPESAR